MAALDTYRAIIANVLNGYTQIPYAYGDLQCKAVFDRENDHYLLVTLGWDNGLRVYSVLVHIDLINGKVWIQQDNTEDGVATELAQAGIPNDHIVLGFQAPELRKYTAFAAA
ncbi:MAG: XisI protein [Candidatus Competibacteraceae bacterium]